MPITKSATKRARQNTVRHARLSPYKTHMKTMIKKISTLAKDGKNDDVKTMLPMVFKSIDVAAKKNLIHRNTADRKKAWVSKLVRG